MNILSKLKELLHDAFTVNREEKGIDLEAQKIDPRDYQYQEHFQEEIFGAALPHELIRTVDDLPPLYYQNSILSCVSCTVSFINSYNSMFNDQNPVKLSWRFPYSLVYHYRTGTNVRENLNILKNKGQCLDLLLPEEEYYLGEREMQNPKHITKQAVTDALNYQIDAYYFMKVYDKVELKTALLTSPIGVGVYLSSNWYATPATQPIKYDGYKGAGHLISIVGWTDKAWIVADWDKKTGRRLKLLDLNYPLELAFTIRDLSDKLKGNLMKPFKLAGTNRLGVILPNGKYQWILTIEQWNAFQEKKMLVGDTKVLTNEDLQQMEEDKSFVAVLK